MAADLLVYKIVRKAQRGEIDDDDDTHTMVLSVHAAAAVATPGPDSCCRICHKSGDYPPMAARCKECLHSACGATAIFGREGYWPTEKGSKIARRGQKLVPGTRQGISKTPGNKVHKTV